MSAPIFARTHHVYDSYRDLWRLVELAGFPTCMSDEIDPSSRNTYIIPVRNGEHGGWPGARARIIHWNLEWCDYPPLAGIREVWHMDAGMAGRIGARYVPIGGDARLRVTPDADKTLDAAYYGYMTWRRQEIARDLQAHGVGLSQTDLWDERRETALAQTRLYIHAHQHGNTLEQGVPGLRMVVATAYRLPVLCEVVYGDAGIFAGHALSWARTARMGRAARYLLDCEPDRQLHADALHDLLCDRYTFRRVIEEAL